MGSLLFTSYVTPLTCLPIPVWNIFSFSADLQLLVTSDNCNSYIDLANSCLSAVKKWILGNGLSFNDDKLKLLWFLPLNYASNFSFSLNVGVSCCHPSLVIRDLGVLFSSDLSLSNQVASVSPLLFCLSSFLVED